MFSATKVFFFSLAVLVGLHVSAPVAKSQSKVVLTAFGPAGAGGDDTQVFQSALNATSIQGQALEIPAGTYNVRPLHIPANSNLVLDPGTVVQATSGYGASDRLVSIDSVQNVSITGTPGQSIFRMRKADYTSGEYRHCLSITGATNVVVNGIQCNDSGGDGLYISGSSQPYSANIQVSNSGFNNNRRQGMSVISAQHLIITNCTFTSTSGTAPSAGIDFEPNGPSDSLIDININGGSASNNAGNGLMFSIERLNSGSAPVSVAVNGFATQANGLSGYYGVNGQDNGGWGAPGAITLTNCTSTLDRQYGAVASYWEIGGTSLIFQNLTVTNANQWHQNIDNAAIAVKRGGGAFHPMGNVHFLGASVIDTTGKLDNYFSAWDWSYIGIAQLQFVNPRQLSGARSGGGVLLSGLLQSALNLP